MAKDGFFFFNDTATTEIYTLSLHDALPISARAPGRSVSCERRWQSRRGRTRRVRRGRLRAPGSLAGRPRRTRRVRDRKSTRLNSSHVRISYAVFCLKKKKKIISQISTAVPG